MGFISAGADLMRDWIALQLCAPMLSFGGTVIDHIGPTERWPGQSLVTGPVANALGWDWTDRQSHQDLQDRLILAAAELRPGDTLLDVQNVQMAKADKAWTTRGKPQGRDGGARTYDSPHRRHRTYLADAHYCAVLGLNGEGGLTLDEITDALERPARPLFIGRKTCLPSRPIFAGRIIAENAHDALQSAILRCSDHPDSHTQTPAVWPVDEGPGGFRRVTVTDLRLWTLGLPAGSRTVTEGII